MDRPLTTGIEFDEEKFAQLILYIAQKSLVDKDFGAVKMAKALRRIDFEAFGRFGAPITGADYQKVDHGIAAKRYKPILDQLIERGSAAIAQQEIHGYPSQRVIARIKPNLDVFTAQEIALIDSVLEFVFQHTATELSILDKDTPGYKLTEYKETIPYGVELLPNEPLPLAPADIKYGETVANNIASHL